MSVHHLRARASKTSGIVAPLSRTQHVEAIQRKNNAARLLDNELKRSQIKARMFSTNGDDRSRFVNRDSPVRISQLLGALLVFGIGATSWGLYEFYTTLTMWPKEVRGELRAGLKAKHRGDMTLARRHLTKTWGMIQKMPPDSLSPDPYLKFSGVAIVLAEVLEAEQDFDEAFSVLNTALIAFVGSQESKSTAVSAQQKGEQVSESSSSTSSSASPSNTAWFARSPPRLSLQKLLNSSQSDIIRTELNSKARMRAVALALKLGDLAEILKRPEEEERCLGFAVTQVLRLVRDEYGLTHDVRRGFVQTTPESKSNSGDKIGDGEDTERGPNHETSVRDILSPKSDVDELGLPTWASLTKTELAAPMERLGAFYARQGKYGNAIILYRVASVLLVQPKSHQNPQHPNAQPSITELCQAFQIENAHMALMMDLHRSHPKDDTLRRDLTRIVTRGTSIYETASRINRNTKTQDDSVSGESEMMLCKETYPAFVFNSAVYCEEQGHLEAAFANFTLAYNALRSTGPREMMYEARENARRLERIIDKNAKQAAQGVAQGGNGDSTRSSDALDNSARP